MERENLDRAWNGGRNVRDIFPLTKRSRDQDYILHRPPVSALLYIFILYYIRNVLRFKNYIVKFFNIRFYFVAYKILSK